MTMTSSPLGSTFWWMTFSSVARTEAAAVESVDGVGRLRGAACCWATPDAGAAKAAPIARGARMRRRFMSRAVREDVVPRATAAVESYLALYTAVDGEGDARGCRLHDPASLTSSVSPSR